MAETQRTARAQSAAHLDPPATADATPALKAVPAAVPADAPFSIAATGPPSRPRRTLKHNDTFAVFDSHGDIGATAGGPDGLFDRDTRYLSHLELLIDGTQPLLLGSSVRDDNLNLQVDLTNPDIYVDDRIALGKDTLHIARAIYLHEGSLHERIAVSNHGVQPLAITLSLAFASDFADIFEVRGMNRERRGRSSAEVRDDRSAGLHYRGLDEVARETALVFDPAPTQLMQCMASYALELAPGARRTILVTVATRGRLSQPTLPQAFFKGLIVRHRELMAATRNVASVETSNKVLNEILCRSMADLYMLVTNTPEGPYPYAGIPWYSTTFGRDGIVTALQMLWADPALAEGVLRRLAAYQSRIEDPRTDAGPGKILHEMRGGEMANLAEIPFGLYYGSVDATPLFVVLAGSYARRTGDYALIRELWPAIERALAWIDGPADPDGDGFVEYARGCETGLANQGWKDFARFRLPRRRPAGDGADRAGRGAGLRLRRQAPRGGLRTRADDARARRRARRPSRRAAPALRGGVLVRGDRHLRAGARRCQGALQGEDQQRRPRALCGHRQARSRQAGGALTLAAVVLLGLGHPHRG